METFGWRMSTIQIGFIGLRLPTETTLSVFRWTKRVVLLLG
jgi:hypothetical protein